MHINGASILLLLRDGKASDLNGLTTMLEAGYGQSSVYARYDVNNALRELKEAALVELEPAPPSGGIYDYGIPNVRVKLTPNWHLIQRSLGFSLTKMAEKREDIVEVTPYFGLPEPMNPPPHIFVVMPFDPKLRPIYDDHILKVAKSLGLHAMRGDDFFTTNHVMSDVWRALYSAQVVIADCTDRNPNVFYEIGLAHTLGRPVVLITQKIKDVPFDLRQIRFIKYDYTPPGMADFEGKLASTLKSEFQID